GPSYSPVMNLRNACAALLVWTATGFAADDPQRELVLGMVAQEKGDPASAEKHFRRALELNVRFAEAHHQLAVVLIVTGKREEAREHLAWALALKPKSPEIRDDIGMSLAKIGYAADAEVLFRDAIKLQTDYVPAIRHLAELLFRLGRREESINAFKAACLVASFDPVPH